MPIGARWLNSIDPVTYTIRVLLPLHVHCEGGVQAGCPTIRLPTPAGMITVDRSALLSAQFDVSVDEIWVNMSWLALFCPIFFLLYSIVLRFIKHNSR